MANTYEFETPEKPIYVSTRNNGTKHAQPRHYKSNTKMANFCFLLFTGIVDMEVVKELGIVSIHHKLPLTMYSNPSTFN